MTISRMLAPPVIFLAMVLAGGCGAGGRYAGWAENHTRNVTVYTDAKLEHEYLQEWLERSYAAYRAFLPDINPGKVDVLWMKVQPGAATRLYSPFDDPAHGWTLATVPSGARIGREGLIVLERREDYGWSNEKLRFDAQSARDHNLAKRQMAHVFVMRAARFAPLWLQTGLSSYLSRYRVHYKGNLFIACFGSETFDEPIAASPDELALQDGRRVTVELNRLFKTDWYRYDGGLRHWYQYTARALTHYLIHGEAGYNRTRFPLFVSALREGKTTEEALAIAYPHILPEEWDEKLAAHVRPSRRRSLISQSETIPHGLCYRIPAERDSDFKPRRQPADPREIAVLLEDVERVAPFRRFGNWVPAEVVADEAAKRPRQGPIGSEPGAGVRRGGAGNTGVPGRPERQGDDRKEGSTPTLRVPAPPPAPADPPPAPPPAPVVP